MVRAPSVIGWLLDERDRKELIAIHSPAYAKTIAHHVTLKVGAELSENAPVAVDPEVVGIADDGIGVQALIVRLGGTTERPDGGTYHITWSLAEGRNARESNDVIARHGWAPCAPFAIKLSPARL